MRAAEELRDDEPETYIDSGTVRRRLGGVSQKWLYRMIRQEGFPSYKMPGGIGGSHLFRWSEVERWMLEHRATHYNPDED